MNVMLSINQVGASKKGAEDSFIFQTALADYFSGAIEVKGESGCFLGYCTVVVASVASCRLKDLHPSLLYGASFISSAFGENHPSCRQDRYDIRKKERKRKFAGLSITPNGLRMVKFPGEMSLLHLGHWTRMVI